MERRVAAWGVWWGGGAAWGVWWGGGAARGVWGGGGAGEPHGGAHARRSPFSPPPPPAARRTWSRGLVSGAAVLSVTPCWVVNAIVNPARRTAATTVELK